MTAVKTQTTRAAQTVTGTLALMNQRTPDNPAEGPGPTWGVSVSTILSVFIGRVHYVNDANSWAYWVAGGPLVYIADPGCAEGEHAYMIGVYGSQAPGDPPCDVALIKTTGDGVTAAFSIGGVDADLWRERRKTAAPGRDGSPVYAKETDARDQWVAREHPWSYAASIGTVSASGAEQWNPDPGRWEPELVWLDHISLAMMQCGDMASTGGTDYASIALAVGGKALNFTGRHRVYGHFDLQGAADTLTVHCDTTGPAPGPADVWYVGYQWPMMVSFAGVHVRDRQGNDVNNVRLSGGFKATPDVPATLGWSNTQ